ncbi:MAG: helix-turn-helix domain-containing protein [Methanomicrobiaceae archaeon]|nr:helix-turn-helix domain-containing protein [Methanomicrobiaceae archaeon]
MRDLPENPETPVESLKLLGLTKYEALVYTALLRMEEATASEIHEISGVPRASVYPVLDRLVQKQLVSVSHTAPKIFSAAPPEEGICRLLEKIEHEADDAREILGDLWEHRKRLESGRQEMIWSLHGGEAIAAKIRDLFLAAREEVQAIATGSLIEKHQNVIFGELDGRVQGEILCDRWEGEQGLTIRVTVIPGHAGRFESREQAGVFIVDGKRALVVMGPEEGGQTALYSESSGFVTLFSRYVAMFRTLAGRGISIPE